MGRLKKIWVDPVWSKGIYDVVKWGFIPVASLLVSYLAGWWPEITAFALSSTQIPNWLLTVLFAISVWKVAGLVVKLIYKPKRSPHTWKLYKKDKINGIVWRWRYDMYGDIVMHDLRPYCPNQKCDRDLGLFGGVDRYSNDPITLGCPDCNTTLITLEKTSRDITPVLDVFMQGIRLEIERKIRKLREI